MLIIVGPFHILSGKPDTDIIKKDGFDMPVSIDGCPVVHGEPRRVLASEKLSKQEGLYSPP